MARRKSGKALRITDIQGKRVIRLVDNERQLSVVFDKIISFCRHFVAYLKVRCRAFAEMLGLFALLKLPERHVMLVPVVISIIMISGPSPWPVRPFIHC